MKHSKNQRGFSHHFILPLLAFIAVGAIGAYVITKSNAATAGPSDVVYSVMPTSGSSGYKYYRYSSATGTTTEYPSDIKDILDVSRDQKWVLQRDNTNKIVARSTTGQQVSYGDLEYYLDSAYDGTSCSSALTARRDFLFSRASSAGSSAPKIYYREGAIACVNGKYSSSQKSPYMTIYSVEANGANKTAVYAIKNYVSYFGFAATLRDVADNGNLTIYAEDGSTASRYYVVSPAGKLLFKGPKNEIVYISESGKKITYAIGNQVYVADANGKKAKKVMYYSDVRSVIGISPTGTYLIYEKFLSKDGKSRGLYAYKVSNKKSYKIDTAYSSENSTAAGITNEHWLPGSNTLVYVKRDSKAKTAQIVRASVTGKSKKVLVSLPYDTTSWMTIY